MKKLISILVALTIVVSSFSVVFAAGDSAEDPVLIATAEDLVAAAQEINKSGTGGAGKYYKLTADIDLGGISWYDSIGTKEVPFVGAFDGNGKIISNFKVPVNSNQGYIGVGLFGTIGGDASIKNLGVEKVTVTGDDTWGWNARVGGIAGEANGNAAIDSCFVRNITFSSNPVNVGAGGGLVGYLEGEGVKITNCYCLGFAELSDCISTEDGLVGQAVSFAEITNCYTDTTLACVASGTESKVTNSYSISQTGWAPGGYARVGTVKTAAELKGLYETLGSAYKEGYAAFGGYPALTWEPAPEGITGTGTQDDPYVVKTPAHFVEIASAESTDGVYYELGNDIDFEGAAVTNQIGTYANPFMGEFDGKGRIIKNYKLIIPASDQIENWQIAAGVFAYVSGDAVIKNLGAENIEVSSANKSWRECAGGIAGIVDGNATISGCYAKNFSYTEERPEYSPGSFIDVMALGGIAAATVSDGVTIENCYTLGITINKVDNGSGVIGAANKFKTIENCYSTYNVAQVRDTAYQDRVVNCYFSGAKTWMVECCMGTQVTATELKGMAETLGAAYTTGSYLTGGMPALVWQPIPESSGGMGTKDDPMLIKTPQDLANVAALENTDGMFFSLESDIDFEGGEWISAIGTASVPFKGIFDGNGHIISNYKISSVGNDIYGLFGVVGGGAYIYDLGVENVKIVHSNAASWDSTAGGLIGLIQDNAVLTGCFAKNVEFSLTYNRDWEGEVKYGGALIGRISGGGVEIRNCYSKGFKEVYGQNPAVNNEGGFAGEGSLYATVANCYSDTTMFRALGWLTNENCYQAEYAKEWPGGYEWDADVVEDISDIGYKLGKEFVNVEGEGPMLRWELGEGKYINLVDGGSFSFDDIDFGAGITLASNKNDRISKLATVQAGGEVSATVPTKADAYYRVSIRTSAANSEGTFAMTVDGADFTSNLKDNAIGKAWETQTSIVKATGDTLTLTFVPSVEAYIDDIEIFEVDVDTEDMMIKESMRLNYQKNSYVDDKVAVDFLVNDGLVINYVSANGYIDGEGYLTEAVPTGFGTIDEDYTGTVAYADRTVSGVVTVTLKERIPYDIKEVQLLDADDNKVYGMAKAEKIGNAIIDINKDIEAKLMVALYKDGKLTAVKTADIADDGVCPIDLVVGDNDTFKVFAITDAAVMPLAIPAQSYKTLTSEDSVTIRTIGDSLAATYDPSATELRGWGQVLEAKFGDNVKVDNSLSLGGMTAQNFLFNGRFDTLLDNMVEGDYVFIQLATNDRVQGFTHDEFKLFLTQFVQMIRDNGGIPVFITSPEESECATNNKLADGTYEIQPVHQGYPEVMKEIGEERDVPVIDLNGETQRLMAEIGYDGIIALNYWTSDTIHFTEAGANYLADFIASEAAALGLPIGEFVK